MGGLNTTNGTNAPYFTNASQEVMFHVVTMMPTVDNDPQQIEKVQQKKMSKYTYLLIYFFFFLEKTCW